MKQVLETGARLTLAAAHKLAWLAFVTSAATAAVAGGRRDTDGVFADTDQPTFSYTGMGTPSNPLDGMQVQFMQNLAANAVKRYCDEKPHDVSADTPIKYLFGTDKPLEIPATENHGTASAVTNIATVEGFSADEGLDCAEEPWKKVSASGPVSALLVKYKGQKCTIDLAENTAGCRADEGAGPATKGP